MIARIRAFASGPPPEPFEAAALLRQVYLATFALQLLLALAIGGLVALLVPVRGAPNDVVALVLLAVAVAHLPLGWALARTAIRAGGRPSALSGVVAAAMLFSIPAWFGVLLVVSGQRPLALIAIAAVISVGYALGFLLTGLATQVATTPEPEGRAERTEETNA